MTKKLMIGTAMAALMVSGALAQAPSSPPPSSSSPPAASPSTSSPPAASTTPDASKDMAKDTAKGTSTSGPNIVSAQKPDQWLASKFKGTDVVGSDDKKIGDVSDVLFDKTGKIEAFVVSVGGFLGMGAKDIALAPTSFEVMPGTNGAADKLKLSMSQDQLKQAQNFTPYEPPRATTTGSGTRPSLGAGPAGTKPSSNTPPASR
jgi:hypothetical protein